MLNNPIGLLPFTNEPLAQPDVMPAAEEAAWMAALTKGAFQGCGHIRLMIDQPTDYGLPNSDVPKFVIEAFYK